jgi:hypothetical protein
MHLIGRRPARSEKDSQEAGNKRLFTLWLACSTQEEMPPAAKGIPPRSPLSLPCSLTDPLSARLSPCATREPTRPQALVQGKPHTRRRSWHTRQMWPFDTPPS